MTRAPGHRRRLPAPACLAAIASLTLVAIAPAPGASARRHHRAVLALSLPSQVVAGTRVLAKGRVHGRARARSVLLQRRAGGRWRTLARVRVAHGGYRIAFSAPPSPGVMILRAVLFHRHRRLSVSHARRLTILARPAPGPVAPAPSNGIVGWGDNRRGQLGAGYRGTQSTLPVSVQGLGGVKQVVASASTSYALMADGTIRAWGGNEWGQLGAGYENEPGWPPVRVAGLSGVVSIAAGGAHAIALLSNGTVASWGANTYGQMGNGTTLEGKEGPGVPTPQIVPGLTGVVSIAAGGGSDAAVLADGTVVAWGENKSGQLGDGTKIEKSRPTPVAGLSGVKQLAVGGVPSLGGHILALLNDGTVRALGNGQGGQLGDGTGQSSDSPVLVKGLSGVAQVSASVSHSLALLQNGTVESWGADQYGELGVGAAPEKCSEGPQSILCSRVPVPVGISGASSVSAGYRFSLALVGGHPLSWGWNESGQLGDGTDTQRAKPVPVQGAANVTQVAAGEEHSLALVQAPPAAPAVEAVPGHGSLTVIWRANQGTEPWGIAWRPWVRPPVEWTNHVSLPAPTRSYTITGLSARPYEVRVHNEAFGVRIVTATPLP